MPYIFEHASSGRARCRGCDLKIDKGELRFIHAGCAGDYLGTTDIMKRVRHFSPGLAPEELDVLKDALA